MRFLSIVLSLVSILTLAQPGKHHAANYRFVNGKWFDGSTFLPRTVYVKDGVIVEFLATVDTTVDLRGDFVVPPFSETHTHLLEGVGDYQRVIQNYINDGVFYIKNPNNIAPFTARLRPFVNKGHSVDAVFANGGITCSGGHPEGLYEDRVRQHLASFIDNAPRGWFNGKAYFVADSEAELDSIWPRIMKGKPDFIKIYLANSEDIGHTPPQSQYPLRKGLAPSIAAGIVKRAHAEGLRVTAHVETRADFVRALECQVDEIAHVPGFYLFASAEDARYQLTAEDAAKAAAQHVFVTTALLSRNLTEDPGQMDRVKKIQALNLRTLRDAGVTITVGSDHAKSPVEEIHAIRDLNVFDNLTLLKMWCENSVRAIFPSRNVGALKPGCEASFLALSGNPIDDFTNTSRITLRFKQGHILEIKKQ